MPELQEIGPARQRGIPALLVLLGITFAMAGIGAAITMPQLPSWYAELAKPGFAPPSWAFSPAWAILNLASAAAAWLVWRSGSMWCSSLSQPAVDDSLPSAWSGLSWPAARSCCRLSPLPCSPRGA